MKSASVCRTFLALAVALAASAAFTPVSRAQGTNPNFVVPKEEQQTQDQQQKEKTLEAGAQQKVDPKEEAAYKAFFQLSPQDIDKRIEVGTDFVQKYPNSRYAESVYGGLAQTYYAKSDWTNLYAVADKALAINPDDVDILVLVGWVIPHVIDSSTPDPDKQLAKAEDFEKRALKDIPTLSKAANVTDDQFTATKAEKTAEAHSGLGLVYFRRGDFDDAVKELHLATQNNPNPDATDFYALGASLQNSGHYADAADAYTRCGQMMSGLQAVCKDHADKAKQLAAGQKQ